MERAPTNPATPQPRAPRNLWPSPSFSDYFSGDEHSATPAKGGSLSSSLNGSLHGSPLQTQLLIRLNHVAAQIASHDLTGEAPTLLTAKLDELEQTLNAPQSQSRSPAEQAETGLYDDDDEAEAEEEAEAEAEDPAEEDGQDWRHEQDVVSRAIVDRITKAQEQLLQRFEEVKHINALATSRIQRDNDEMRRLRSENRHFHTDLSDIHSIMLRLKMQLKAIEVQAAPHIDLVAGESMHADIQRWKMEWEDVDARLKRRRHLYERRGSSSTSLMDGNGMSSSSMHLNIIRTGLISRADSDPFIDSASSLGDTQSLDTESKGRSWDGDATGRPMWTDSPVQQQVEEAKPAEAERPADVLGSPAEKSEESDDSELESPPPEKTPWQELWDSLTEYAGIMEYDD